MVNIRILECNRCKHSWPSRLERDPKACPKCKSPYWNTPRIKNRKCEFCKKALNGEVVEYKKKPYHAICFGLVE